MWQVEPIGGTKAGISVMSDMKRRDVIKAIAGSAMAWPLAAHAQGAAMPVIGFLRDTSLAHVTYLVVAFRRGLKEAGVIEGQNVVIEYRSAEDKTDGLPALVADLVRRQVALIVCNTASAIDCRVSYWPDHHLLVEPMRIIVSNTVTGASR
jgi:hypothetical protein